MAVPNVKLRRSSSPDNPPTTSDIDLGELAINTHDGKLFLKRDATSTGGPVEIVELLGFQITNFLILDDISSSFNGSTTSFTIQHSGGTDFTNSILTTPARLLVSLGGILQEPDPTSSTGFNITGSGPVNIVFAEAPEAGQTFFGIAFGVTTSAPLTNVTSEEDAIAYAIVLG